MNFSTRAIKIEDLDELSIIFADAFRPEETGEHWAPKLAKPLIQYWFERSPEDLRILAHNEVGKILGAFFADVKPWWDGPRLVDGEFFVLPEFQGKGIGTSLFKSILHHAKSNHNVTCFETITFTPDTEHPLNWYLKMGFVREKDLVVINGAIDDLMANFDT